MITKAKLHSTRNDLPESVRNKIIDLLNQNLADVLDLGLQTKQAHWNVKGPNFIALHELFDKLAEELEEFSDDIAERPSESRRSITTQSYGCQFTGRAFK